MTKQCVRFLCYLCYFKPERLKKGCIVDNALTVLKGENKSFGGEQVILRGPGRDTHTGLGTKEIFGLLVCLCSQADYMHYPTNHPLGVINHAYKIDSRL